MILEFQPICSGILSLIEEWEPRLLQLSEQSTLNKRNSQNRSIKQIVGHMVDSASNNRHRFVHLQYQESPLNYPNYATNGNNDRWIAIQNYQGENWSDLLHLWKYSNMHVVHVIRNVDSGKLENIFIIIMLFCSIFAFSQPDMENIKNQPYLKYSDKADCDSAITTLELRICANLKYQKSDSLLNDLYQEIMSGIKNGYLNIDEALFQRSQEAWKAYRDSHCNIFWEMHDGGSLQSVVYMECLADITNERIGGLKELLEKY